MAKKIKTKPGSQHGIRICVLGMGPDGKFKNLNYAFLYDMGWNYAMAEALALVHRLCGESYKPESVTIEHFMWP